MQLAKAGHQLAQANPTYRIFQFFGVLALWIAGCFAISIQLFTRKGFGERYASVANCVLGVLALGMFTGLGNVFISWMAQERLSVLMEMFYTSAIVMVVFHRVMIWDKNRKKVIWHSMYSGSSLLSFTGLPEGFLKRWAEPAILLMLAALARNSHEHAVGLWLEIGAISVFIHETLAAAMERAEMLDRRDSWIEHQFKNDALQGTQRKDQGFSMAQSSIELLKQTPEAVTGFSSEVMGMLDREAQA